MGLLKNLRWPLVGLSLLVSLGLLLGGSAVVRHLRVDSPLRSALMQDPAVLGYQLDDGGARSVLHVQLRAVADLAEAYRRIDAAAAKNLGAGRYRIIVEDKRTPALAETYHRIHFALEEGLQRGTYDEMAARVQRETADAGLTGQRVTVSDGRIYVQLHRGDYYLYAVLERNPAQGGEAS